MKFLQMAIFRLNCLALIVAGIAAFKYDYTWLHNEILRIPDSTPLRMGLGALIVILGLIGLVPWPKGKNRKQKLVFKGTNGNVTIVLSSVEQALNKSVKKMSEVKRVSVKILPSNTDRNIQIKTDITLLKPPHVSAREVEAHVSNFITDQVKRILGPETAVAVDMNIVDIIVEESATPIMESTVEPEKKTSTAIELDTVAAEEKEEETISEAIDDTSDKADDDNETYEGSVLDYDVDEFKLDPVDDEYESAEAEEEAKPEEEVEAKEDDDADLPEIATELEEDSDSKDETSHW